MRRRSARARTPSPGRAWVETFVVFVISHLVGDYLVQTEWQALNKRGALSGSWLQRRALASHIATYTGSYVPGLIWLTRCNYPGLAALAAAIGIPHFIQDDGTLLRRYSLAVKHADLAANPPLEAAVDQSFHLLALFATALLAGGRAAG